MSQVQILPVQVFELMLLLLKMQLVTVAESTLHKPSVEFVIVDLFTSVLYSDVCVTVDARQVDLAPR